MEGKDILSKKEIQEWIQKQYRNTKKITELHSQFKQNTPFSYIELQDFFIQEKIVSILKALRKEEFLEKESDLFKFMQTHDFATTDIQELQELKTFLSSRIFLTYIEEITGVRLNQEVDISASMYQNTDYLLPHDDRLAGRKIAFMIYLSNLEAKDGGKLIFYKTKGSIPKEEEKAITPKFNTLVLFKVSEKSFHEVEEVISNTQRITIGGWFHGESHKSTIPQERKY